MARSGDSLNRGYWGGVWLFRKSLRILAAASASLLDFFCCLVRPVCAICWSASKEVRRSSCG